MIDPKKQPISKRDRLLFYEKTKMLRFAGVYRWKQYIGAALLSSPRRFFLRLRRQLLRHGRFVYIHKNLRAVLCNVTRDINILQ